jgi:hypothetical protein
MSVREVTVTYERKFSDGNYGSEGLSLSVTVTENLNDEQALDVADSLRKTVLSFLGGSAAERVSIMARRELNPRTPQISAPSDAPEGLEDIPF